MPGWRAGRCERWVGCRKGPDGWGASDPVGTACWADQLELKAQTLPCRLAAPEPGRARQRRPGPVSDLPDEAADPSTGQGLSRGQSAAWCLAGSGLRHGCPSASILLPAIGVQGQRRRPPSAGQGEPHKWASSFTQGVVQIFSRRPENGREALDFRFIPQLGGADIYSHPQGRKPRPNEPRGCARGLIVWGLGLSPGFRPQGWLGPGPRDAGNSSPVTPLCSPAGSHGLDNVLPAPHCTWDMLQGRPELWAGEVRDSPLSADGWLTPLCM